MMRRKLLGLLAAPLALRGTGGTPPQPAGYGPPLLPGVAPGSTSRVVRARQVIVTGPGEGVFVYSPAGGLGNLVASVTSAAGTDPYGNTFLAGTTTYINVGGGVMDAVNISGITITFFISPTPGGTYVSQGILVGTSGGHVQAHGTFVDLFGTSQITLNAPSVLLDNTAVNQIPAPPPSLTTSFSSTYSSTVAAQLGANFTQLLSFFHSIGLT